MRQGQSGKPANNGVGQLPILMYHSLDSSGSVVSIAPQTFADQMACISDLGLRGICLRDAVRHFEMNGSWPERSAVITFDDGFASFHESGLEPLARHGFTATVFLVSNYIGAQNSWDTPPPGLGIRPILNWRQIGEVTAAGMEIGAHTHNHRNLRKLSEPKVEYEIVRSRRQIEDHSLSPVESFAYPYGEVSGAAVKVAAREFRSACTTILRPAHAEPMHLLPRVDMYYLRSISAFKRLLGGQLDYYLAFRRLGRAVRRAMSAGI